MLLPSEKRKGQKMFEQEIKEVRSKLAKSLILWREADSLERKIRQEEAFKNNTVYWIGHSLKSKCYIYEYAGNDLNQRRRNRIGDCFRMSPCYSSKDFKKACNTVRNTQKNDIINRLKEYINSEGWQHIQPEIINNAITIGLSDYNLNLLLTSLNILINDDIETVEVIDKARNALKECNTFVYRNIKITIYKNGKTKLVFADKNILEKFKELIEN